jgi:hypothetical protein
VDAHVAKTVAAKPQLVQISTAYCKQQEGSPVLPRNRYVALRDEKPKSKEEAKRKLPGLRSRCATPCHVPRCRARAITRKALGIASGDQFSIPGIVVCRYSVNSD